MDIVQFVSAWDIELIVGIWGLIVSPLYVRAIQS